MTTFFLVVLVFTATISATLIFILIHNYRRLKNAGRSSKASNMSRKPKLLIRTL